MLRKIRRAVALAEEAYAEELSRRCRGRDGVQRTRTIRPLRTAVAPEQRRIAVICHAYYPDLLFEIRDVVANLPGHVDLHVSVMTEADGLAAEDCFAGWSAGLVDVRVVENRGRDIMPKYVTFADVPRSDGELLLFLHTKKSTDPLVGPRWRRFLFESLAGSRRTVDDVLALFDGDPRLGVLAPAHFGPITPWIGWSGNYRQTRRLARRMGTRIPTWAAPDFPSGSMFWARPAALAPIYGLRLSVEDFPAEPSPREDTIMHGLERLVFVSAESAGYTAAMLGPGTEDDRAAERVDAAAHSARPPLALRLLVGLHTLARLADESTAYLRATRT